MRELDRAVFAWINHWPESLAPVFLFFSEGIKTKGVRIGLGLLIIALLAWNAKTRKTIILAFVAWPLANGLTDQLKNVFQMARPDVDYAAWTITRVHQLTSYGTASAHAANMAAIAFVFTYYLKGWGAIWIAVALITGLSRIYVGVHYPSQVLLGWVCGAFCGLLVVKTWEAFSKMRKGPEEETISAATTPTA